MFQLFRESTPPINQLIQFLLQHGRLSEDLQIKIHAVNSCMNLDDNPDEQLFENEVMSLLKDNFPGGQLELEKELNNLKAKKQIKEAVTRVTGQFPSVILEGNTSVQYVTSHHISAIQNALEQQASLTKTSSFNDFIARLAGERGLTLNLQGHQAITGENIYILGTELSQGRRGIMIIQAFGMALMIAISPVKDEESSAYSTYSIRIPFISNQARYMASTPNAVQFLNALMEELKAKEAQLLLLGPPENDPVPTRSEKLKIPEVD